MNDDRFNPRMYDHLYDPAHNHTYICRECGEVTEADEPLQHRATCKVVATSPKLNPWHPIKDAVTLKHLGKLGEETGELSAAISRCIIQGIDEREPVTGKVNREWLEDELADVAANAELVTEFLGLNGERMQARKERKKASLRTWHLMA